MISISNSLSHYLIESFPNEYKPCSAGVDKYLLYKFLFFIFVSLTPVVALAVPAPALSPELPAHYTIEAVLDDNQKLLKGNETVRFYNLTDDSLDVVIFQLYPDAFKDTLTAMASGSKAIKAKIAKNKGYITCDSVMIDDEKPDSVRNQETLLYIYPSRKLSPASVSEIRLYFELKIPPVILRYGYDESDNYVFAHWFPILVGFQNKLPIVFEYDNHTEFFSNFANFDISLILPANFLVGSTAGVIKPDSSSDSLSYFTASAAGVIDFAFACGPAWQIESFEHDNAEISIFYLRQSEEELTEVKKYISGTLNYFENRLYEYPYPTFTVIDFDPGGRGMELPGMIVMPLSGDRQGGRLSLSLTLIHETTHQWFYATIATNEAFEPWLDEGFATYYADRVMSEIAGKSKMIDFPGISFSYTDLSVIMTRLTKTLSPLASRSSDFHGSDYFLNAYGRATAVIKTLEGVVGGDNFDKAMKSFAQQYKFKHPNTSDLQRCFEDVLKIDLGWFFDDLVMGTSRVDYEVASIRSSRMEAPAVADTGKESFKIEIEMRRNYDGVLPQELILKCKNGEINSYRWDGKEKYHVARFISDSPAEWVAIDTGYYYLIDENLANNSKKLVAESYRTMPFNSSLFFLMQILLALAGIL